MHNYNHKGTNSGVPMHVQGTTAFTSTSQQTHKHSANVVVSERTNSWTDPIFTSFFFSFLRIATHCSIYMELYVRNFLQLTLLIQLTWHFWLTLCGWNHTIWHLQFYVQLRNNLFIIVVRESLIDVTVHLFQAQKTLDNCTLTYIPKLVNAVPQTNISNYCENLYQFISC